MLSRKDKDQKPVVPLATSPSSASSAGRSQVRTVIGQNISINGDISGQEDLVIEGSVKGSIELPNCHLTVGTNGKVEAEINADNVTISGRLTGNIKAAGKVEITKDADFTGEIKASRISVEDGAYLKAVIELSRDAKGAGSKPGTTPATALASSNPAMGKEDKKS